MRPCPSWRHDYWLEFNWRESRGCSGGYVVMKREELASGDKMKDRDWQCSIVVMLLAGTKIGYDNINKIKRKTGITFLGNISGLRRIADCGNKIGNPYEEEREMRDPGQD
ncbi:hypothetical protein KQX54_005180 [Cotesia glomerata]|uniref:Uncharacterized protein n=1 Tax=Cotesia glomerata TaxID=32391 RepID=A0AAV7I709_COTGL|nr:hypothetical protein KQX54_005180 [Cotesia glomerata]